MTASSTKIQGIEQYCTRNRTKVHKVSLKARRRSYTKQMSCRATEVGRSLFATARGCHSRIPSLMPGVGLGKRPRAKALGIRRKLFDMFSDVPERRMWEDEPPPVRHRREAPRSWKGQSKKSVRIDGENMTRLVEHSIGERVGLTCQ
jgi:hypothetical protein